MKPLHSQSIGFKQEVYVTSLGVMAEGEREETGNYQIIPNILK